MRRKRAWALAIGCIPLIGLAVAAKAARPPRSPTAQVRVAAQPTSLEERSVDPVEAEQFRQTQLSLLRSELVLLQALRQHNGRMAHLPPLQGVADQVGWLADRLEIRYDGDKSEILSVSLPDVDPRVAVEIVNTVVETYLQEVVDKERMTLVDQLNTLRAASTQLTKQVQSDLDKVHHLTSGTTDRRYELATAELRELAEDRRQLREQLAQVNREIAKNAAAAPDSAEQRTADQLRAEAERLKGDLQQLQAQRDKLREELSAMAAYNSEVAAIGRRIPLAEAALEKLDADIYRRDLELKLPSRVHRWAMAELPPES
ncbi:MAG: DUF4200 domain-containing protein [Pirellulales bacterium]